MSGPNKEFGEAVQIALQSRGWSQNRASVVTGLDRGTVSRMVAGFIPRLDRLEKWAQGLEESTVRWRNLAGDTTIEHCPFALAVDRIAQDFGEEFSVTAHEIRMVLQSPETIEQCVAAIRHRAEVHRNGG